MGAGATIGNALTASTGSTWLVRARMDGFYGPRHRTGCMGL
jgi:hypothetical protein